MNSRLLLYFISILCGLLSLMCNEPDNQFTFLFIAVIAWVMALYLKVYHPTDS